MRFLGVDVGSSFIKGAVLDLDDGVVSAVERTAAPEPVGGLEPTFREVEPETFLDGTRRLLERLHGHAPDAAGVVLCSQLHGTLLCDGEARPLTRYVTWQDTRTLLPLPGAGESCFDELERIVGPDDRRLLGNERVPGLPINQLYRLARLGRLPAGAIPTTLPFFVAARLCKAPIACDITQAYGLGAVNVRTLDWHRPVLERLGLDGLAWPTIVPQGAVVGEWRHGGRAIPVHAPVGDYHCSQVGALLQPGELSVNISTGSAVIQIADGCETGDFQTRPWFDGTSLKTITHIPGGRAINAMLTLLGELAAAEGVTLGDPWGTALARAAQVADGGGLAVDPAFYAGSMGDHGTIANLREENMTVGHLFRALFAGMADNYARAAARIAPGRDWSRLVFSGGVAMKTPLLRRLIMDRLGSEHRLAPVDEDTLFGLLVLARAFAGRSPTVAAAIASVSPPAVTRS